MPIFAEKYTTLKSAAPKKMEIPDGAWQKCKSCGRTRYTDILEENFYVCGNCGNHMPIGAVERIEMLVDPLSFQAFDSDLHSQDPLGLTDSKSYTARIAESEAKTALNEAIVCGKATIGGYPLALGVMDFRFMGASMGSVVGEKIARLAEHATAEKLPLILFTASGGARMQEGILSLMQMAKTCGAIERHSEAGLLYITVLTHPTYGGVTASFATVADIIFAEPGAMVGFAGPRVIKETTNAKLPEGFQTSEFLVEKGLVDRIVERKNLRKELLQCLEFSKNGCIVC